MLPDKPLLVPLLKPDPVTSTLFTFAVDRTLLVTLAVAILSFILSSFVAYSYQVDATHSRLSSIESKQQSDTDRLNRIETKVDQLLARPIPR